jgi:hypothetical protein
MRLQLHKDEHKNFTLKFYLRLQQLLTHIQTSIIK